MRNFISIIILVSFVGSAHADISLDSAINKALKADHWQFSNINQEMAVRSQAMAAAQLPDPKVRVALANLPLDTFDFNQENMTQLQVGMSQQFPRGDSLELKQQQLELLAGKNPLQRLERSAQIKLSVSKTWLALHQSEQQLALLQSKKHIFDELVAVSRAKFRSGNARRFEVLDAEVQLTKFKDRIILIEKMISQQQAQLQKWLYIKPTHPLNDELKPPKLLSNINDEQAVIDVLTQHPQMQLLAQDIQVKDKGIAIAEEAYKPGFKFDATYGYRDDSDVGMERADFLTVALTMDLPLFPEKRQDQTRAAAIQNREASREIRILKARELRAGFEIAKAGLDGLEQRLEMYDQTYLVQQSLKRKAALKAYASADARFNEVSMAAMTELETQLQQIALLHEAAMAKAEINYYLAGIDPQLQSSFMKQEGK